jgi:four helix bundle protein
VRIERFEDLGVWKKARELVRATYEATSDGKLAQDLGLSRQMQRAAISAMANIAEGFERGGNKEFLQYLAMVKGSCAELRSHLYAALDLGYISDEEFQSIQALAISVARQSAGLMKYLRSSKRRGSKYRSAMPNQS